MKQLLHSIQSIAIATEGRRHFESHVFFDNGMDDSEKSKHASQLLRLVRNTFETTAEEEFKTPYGHMISYTLQFHSKTGPSHSMSLKVHLKDKRKVKQKKRWSQILYMTYVLDFLTKAGDEGILSTESQSLEDAFILSTDGDVEFSCDSVVTLIDRMYRDPNVGAVCGRTHPAGNGLLAWYQTFEYAIGHWLQKATEHVIGSVMCAPGCFSVYRCTALKKIVAAYGEDVEKAFDFLTKDMGEDRWLSTLLIKSGYQIEYCAASECSTFCPTGFTEFFKQRRRWIASSLANAILFLREQKAIRNNNHNISRMFIIYQLLCLLAAGIGPSTVVLIIAGGLAFAWKLNIIAASMIQVFFCGMLMVIFLSTTLKTQLLVARFYFIVYTIIMAVGMIGVVLQSVREVNAVVTGDKSTSSSATWIAKDFPISATTLYLAILVGLTLLTAILHYKEWYLVLYGGWYLLFIPTGFVVLTIYSICNMTDITWGTREGSASAEQDTNDRNIFRRCFLCIEVVCSRWCRSLMNVTGDSTSGNLDHSASIYPEAIDRKNHKHNQGSTEQNDITNVSKLPEEEWKLWERLIEKRLLPQKDLSLGKSDLLEKLKRLRSSWLIALVIANALWLTVFLTLGSTVELKVKDTNILGLIFLSVFSAVFVIQFLAMLVHRLQTFTHYLARIPYTWNEGYINRIYSMQDKQQKNDENK